MEDLCDRREECWYISIKGVTVADPAFWADDFQNVKT